MRFISLNISLQKIISDFLVFNKKVCRKRDATWLRTQNRLCFPVASKTSKIRRDNHYSKTSKSVADSALLQTRPKKK